MAALSTTDIFEFNRFRVDRRGLFRRDGDATPAPVEIGSRALEVLRALLDRPGDLISRDEIMAAAWPGIVVEDNNLTIQIAALAARTRSRPRERQLHPDGAAARVSLCRVRHPGGARG